MWEKEVRYGIRQIGKAAAPRDGAVSCPLSARAAAIALKGRGVDHLIGLRGKRDDYHRKGLLLAMAVGVVAIPLQIVSGDPLFYQSALEAVRRWRYKPTTLNGELVEIDTFITVIYTAQQ